jgi:hypothetical protein
MAIIARNTKTTTKKDGEVPSRLLATFLRNSIAWGNVHADQSGAVVRLEAAKPGEPGWMTKGRQVDALTKRLDSEAAFKTEMYNDLKPAMDKAQEKKAGSRQGQRGWKR